jgi:tetratricopeptide (TPR) repeat protein
MKYIVITVVAISVNVIIMYTLGNKVLGVKLRPKSLIMCGFCALLLSLVLPRIIVNFTSIAVTIAFFAVFAIILAGFIVYYDGEEELDSISSPGQIIEIEPDSLSEFEYLYQKACLEDEAEVVVDTILVNRVETKESSKPYLLNSPVGESIEAETPEYSKNTEEQLESEYLLEPDVVKTTSVESSIAKVIVEAFSTCEEDSSSVSKAEMMPDNKVLVLDNDKNTTFEEVEKSQSELGPASDSLDDLLECAFSYKERGDDACALATFKYALTLHRDKEIAPFLVIEMANLLKKEGSYDDAIAVLTESRNLSAIRENHGLDQDFINTIAYLRIIKNTLAEHHLAHLPIGEIPIEIFKGIDDEFREWRSFSNVSNY